MNSELVVVMLFSGKILFASCLINLLIGTPVGIYLALNGSKRSCRIIDIATALPLVFPPIGLGFFLIVLFGRNGVLGKSMDFLFNQSIIFSPMGVFLASFIASFPLMLKAVQSSAVSLSSSILEMAALQGANRVQILLHIVLPNIKMGIMSGLTLTIGRSLGEVGITLMLGGNIIGKTETISLAIYNAVFEGNFHRAALLSILLAGVSVCLFTFIQRSGYER